MAEKKKRTTKLQFQIYLNAIEEKNIILTGKSGPSDTPELLKQIWENLASKLNACGDGPTRSSKAWKKVFTEWKSSTRKKARQGKELSSTENKLFHLTGTVAVSGIQPVSELGMGSRQEEEEEINLNPNSDNEIDMSNFSQEEDENVIFEIIPDNQPQQEKKQKRKRTKTSDILCNAYSSATKENCSQLANIAEAISEVASATRYCDIL